MLTPSVVAEIQRLLHQGVLSQRAIARHLGVSRGTVHAIAQGKRRDHPPGPDRSRRFPRTKGAWQRCPGCGGTVQMPCLLCQVRTMREHRAAQSLEPCA